VWQFVRTTSSYASWLPAVIEFVTWANWRRIAIVVGVDAVFVITASRFAAHSQQAAARIEAPMTLTVDAGFDGSQLDKVSIAGLRVVFVMAYGPDVLRVALAAKKRGMLVQGWAWLGLDTVAGADASTIAQLEPPEAAKAAMQAWVYFEPFNTAPAALFARARAATRATFPQQFDDDAQLDALATPFAANMYDAVMLYAMAVGSNASRRSNGRHLAQVMMNMSFAGMSGRVELDEHGDLKESIGAMNYVVQSGGTMRGRRIGVYDAPSRRYLPVQNGTVVWPGNAHAVPADMAASSTAQGFDTVWLLVGAGATAAVVVSGLVVLIRRRHAHLQAVFMMLLTETGTLVLSISMALGNLATDGIVCNSLLRGDLRVSTPMYTASYVVLLCFGVVVTVLSIGYRLRNARLMHAQLQQVVPQGRAVATGEAQRQAQQSEWELVQTHRTKVTLTLSLASIAAQGVRCCRASPRVCASRLPVSHELQICPCPS
jgi:hypothetical protein